MEVGDKVTYNPGYKSEIGIIKEVPEDVPDSVRVVFHCNDDWENYKEYTSQLTELKHLTLGWK